MSNGQQAPTNATKDSLEGLRYHRFFTNSVVLTNREPPESVTGTNSNPSVSAKRQVLIAAPKLKTKQVRQYGEMLFTTIKRHWTELLNGMEYPIHAKGKVVVIFYVHQDGRVTDVEDVESTAGSVASLICLKAVSDCSPFKPWPSGMKEKLGSDEYCVQFTFFY
jgi:outer membrane biosynthesis protein TonB